MCASGHAESSAGDEGGGGRTATANSETPWREKSEMATRLIVHRRESRQRRARNSAAPDTVRWNGMSPGSVDGEGGGWAICCVRASRA